MSTQLVSRTLAARWSRLLLSLCAALALFGVSSAHADPQGGGWDPPPGPLVLLAPASRVAVFEQGGVIKSVVRMNNGHLMLNTWSVTNRFPLSSVDLTAATGTPLAAGDPSVYIVDGIITVVYRVAGTGRIMSIYQSGSGWWYYDLNYAAQGSAPLAAGDPVGYSVNGDQFVAYRATSGAVIRLHQYGTQGWSWKNLNFATGNAAPLAASDVTAYRHNGAQHIAYRTSANRIVLLTERGSRWEWEDLLTAAGGGAPLAAGDPTSYVFGTNQTVTYRSSAGIIVQLYQNGGSWGSVNLHWASKGGAPAAVSDPQSYVVNGESHSVIYRDSLGFVVQLYKAGVATYGDWGWMRLQWKAGVDNNAVRSFWLASSEPSGAMVNGRQVVMYVGDWALRMLHTNPDEWKGCLCTLPPLPPH